jgi:glycosyltransferase involved in cell wall biosynthesis
VVISYTDGFSLSLGLGVSRCLTRPILIGGFHGLSDLEIRAHKAARPLVRTLIRRAMHGLDHVFFFGPADREIAIGRYGVDRERSSVITFGVDTSFWRPLKDTPPADFVVAVGQDRNRDYDLLAAAPGHHPTLIVTRQKVKVPQGASHIMVTAGDFFGADSMTDEDLRRTYNSACAVVVPLRDVWQPSGYSVTLQAMSCSRPVILSNIRGLWSKELLRDNENCLLVPPGDAGALGRAIARLRESPQLSTRLGQAARQTVLQHFGLDKIAAGTLALARLGLALWTARSPANRS